MTTTLTMPASIVLGAGDTTNPWRADARLAAGGQEPSREHHAGPALNPQASDAARWQRVLDQLDPDKRCGAWSPVTFTGRPVVCARAPHDAREQHSDTQTGWSWYDEKS